MYIICDFGHFRLKIHVKKHFFSGWKIKNLIHRNCSIGHSATFLWNRFLIKPLKNMSGVVSSDATQNRVPPNNRQDDLGLSPKRFHLPFQKGHWQSLIFLWIVFSERYISGEKSGKIISNLLSWSGKILCFCWKKSGKSGKLIC